MIMTEQEMYYAELKQQCSGLVWLLSIGVGFAPTARENNIMRGEIQGYEQASKALQIGQTVEWLDKLIGHYAAEFAVKKNNADRDQVEGRLSALRHVRDAIVDNEYLYDEE